MMITEIEIVNQGSNEFIIAAFTWDERFRIICNVDEFKDFIDSTFEMSEYKRKYPVDYGDGEYGWEWFTEWDDCFHYFFERKYINIYLKSRNILPINLPIYED